MGNSHRVCCLLSAVCCLTLVDVRGQVAGCIAGGEWEPAFNHRDIPGPAGGFDLTLAVVQEPPPPLPNGYLNWRHAPLVGRPLPPDTPNFNALHVGLIPSGPYRGYVVAFDKEEGTTRTHQRWTIINPYWPGNGDPFRFRNFWLPMPPPAPVNNNMQNDLFCAGHVWTGDATWIVSGGTSRWPSPGKLGFDGSKLTYRFDPSLMNPWSPPGFQQYGIWTRLADLQVQRWYPTCTVADQGRVIVSGGTNATTVNQDLDTYERYYPTGNVFEGGSLRIMVGTGAPNPYVFYGPDASASVSKVCPPFGDYPRMTLLSNGEMFFSGFSAWSAKVLHSQNQTANAWSYLHGTWKPNLNFYIYGSNFLFPNVLNPGAASDVIVRVGGLLGKNTPPACIPEKTLEFCGGVGAPNAWDSTSIPSMVHARYYANAVVLPDSSAFVIGGQKVIGDDPGMLCPGIAVSPYACTAVDLAPAINPPPELFKISTWQTLPAQLGLRSYHSAALLLPDGRIFVSGGECRSWDYQIYKPEYLCTEKKRALGVAVNLPANTAMAYRSGPLAPVYTATWTNTLPLGTVVSKVVLMRPGSCTHHTDMDQRYLELAIAPQPDPATPNTVYFYPPWNANHAPKGRYMVFLVTNAGVPSTATWIDLQ